MKKLTLYTGWSGYELYKDNHYFLASVERYYESDYAFTVNEDDVRFHTYDEVNGVKLYDVIGLDSVEWLGDIDD